MSVPNEWVTHDDKLVLQRDNYDVAVIGAGPAGVTAAAAAAAAIGGTTSIILIEASKSLGGSVSAAMHRSVCGLYSHAPQSPLDTLNAGGQRDVIAGMVRFDPTHVTPKLLGKAWVLEFSQPAWDSALADHCFKLNVEVATEMRVRETRRESGRITALSVESVSAIKQPPTWIQAKMVIDCTGGGSILQMIGDDAVLPEEEGRMLAGFAVKFSGLTGDLESLRLRIPYVLSKAVTTGELPNEAKFTQFHPGPGEGEGICKLAVHPDHFGPGEANRITQQVIGYLKSKIESLAAGQIEKTSPAPLPRDGKRLRGRAIVTEEDVQQGRQIGPDAVHAWWPIERWDVSTGPSYNYPPDGRHYDIPDDALRSAVLENLLAAGTCVSATSAAAASLRASGICLATGHAAGRLAASMVV